MKSYSTENQQVSNSRTMYYQMCDLAGLCTPAERKIARKSSPVSERRSSKPQKSVTTGEQMFHWVFNNTPAKIFHVGLKSDLYSPMAEKEYIVVDGVPCKRVDGRYVPLTMKSTTEPMVTEMYQYLLLLAEGGPGEAEMFEQFMQLSDAE